MQSTVNCNCPVQLQELIFTHQHVFISELLLSGSDWWNTLTVTCTSLHPPCLSWLQKHLFNFSKLHFICVLIIWKLEPDGQKLQEGMHEKIQELFLLFSILLIQLPGNTGEKGALCLKDIFTASKTTNEVKKRQLLRTLCQNSLASNTSSQLTVHKLLLLLGQDAGQVATLQPTFPLCSVPRAPVCHVLIAVGLKLLPTVSANLRV